MARARPVIPAKAGPLEAGASVGPASAFAGMTAGRYAAST